MATSQVSLKAEAGLFPRIEAARGRTDALFKLLTPNSFYDRPVAERHRLIFYLGHLEAFDWNLLNGALGLQSCDPEFDKLFSFGIDPVEGGLPTDVPADWPSIARVEKYNLMVRRALDEALRNPPAASSAKPELLDGTLLHVAIEHRLMHAETLAYLLHNLPSEKKNHESAPVADPTMAPRARQVTIPAGVATLGRKRGSGFGWDNEFDEQKVSVESFSIDVYPVSNHEYLKFVQAGGYQNAKYWRPGDWDWKNQQRLEYPSFWTPRSSSAPFDPDMEWDYRSMFGTIPLPPSWPVYVSHAEAAAFARWAGRKLPTEAQWHRAAYGTPEGGEREYPWGDTSPEPARGNFHHMHWDATSVHGHPEGASAFGVFDLLGNGWEWTSTQFHPLPGFEPFPFYPGYSANFFDEQHYVMKGGSPRTDACMLRRSFRNWFQPHYPYVYATFRCVEE